jgi:hypothetical protein
MIIKWIERQRTKLAAIDSATAAGGNAAAVLR